MESAFPGLENNNINGTASRELVEETGAKDFEIRPVCIYSVNRDNIETFGQLFYGQIESFNRLEDSEIGEVRLFDTIPGELTYPLIQPYLFKKVKELRNK